MGRSKTNRPGRSVAAPLAKGLREWIDLAAAGILRVRAVLRPARRIQFAEQADGEFLISEWRKGGWTQREGPRLRLERGQFVPLTEPMGRLLQQSHVEVVLAPSRFILRQLELPQAAKSFLDGVVRSQIDRLTPWSAQDAAFGWSQPADGDRDRITILVAATATALVAPVVQALHAARVADVRVTTRVEQDHPVVIPVASRQWGGVDSARRLRQGLIVTLAASLLLFVVSFIAWSVLGAANDARLAALQGQIADRRGALLDRRDAVDQTLETRKQTARSAVMTLEALSKALPDAAHLTELHIDGDKIQIVGLADDAPALIPILEQSQRFTRATFFAPTVRDSSGGSIFHIEASIKPSFGAAQ